MEMATGEGRATGPAWKTAGVDWWSQAGSNRRPPHCEKGACRNRTCAI